MNDVVMLALRKAGEIRKRNNIGAYEPLNVFDLCCKLGITVRFSDINMEGMYFSRKDGLHPQILISNLRPFPRRAFTCAHELGHHLFGHGSKIDALSEGGSEGYNHDEFLVDTFAGALLMPITGILAEFAKRGLDVNTASPEQMYIVASTFSTGYSTLITHCLKNKILKDPTAQLLLKSTPSKILEGILGERITSTHFKVLDEFNSSSVVDLETTNYIILPETMMIEGNHLNKVKHTAHGIAYRADTPGITRVVSSKNAYSYFIRIQNIGYIGLAEYRHLENTNE